MRDHLRHLAASAHRGQVFLRAFFEAIVDELGAGFHPDTPFNEYVRPRYEDGDVLGVFSSDECAFLEAAMRRVAGTYQGDYYAVAVEVVVEKTRR